MKLTRAAGILLHPTSLPSRYGIGDLGPEAERFLDFLTEAGQRYWQVLPLNPVGGTHSPYRAYSAFAGNPLLISPERLTDHDWLPAGALRGAPRFPADRVDFKAANGFRAQLLRQAFRSFKGSPESEAFAESNQWWLEDYALFMALKNHHRGAEWDHWERPLAARHPRALKQAAARLATEVRFHSFVQYLFFSQYGALKREANARGVQLIGDLPIFVSHNSADVWANPHLFHLDRQGRAKVVAGVPPDYFSKTGQRWGNPLYHWEAMAQEGYAWWVNRLRMALTLYDVVRIDHFRGFEACWAIPAAEKTAVNGEWTPGPGARLFKALRQHLGDLPIIAEDLGLITPGVERLRDQFRLPGMKVLQFGFSDPANIHLPHNYTHPNCVVYPGTHDNNTTRGWWQTASPKERQFARRYLNCDRRRREHVSWALARLALGSIANLAVVPLQDLLDLGAEGRMNTPGVQTGNWGWRYRAEALTSAIADRLRELTALYGRAA